MKPRAIQSAGLKLGLRAFDSPQQPAGLPTPGPASFPARHKPPVWFSQGPATADGEKRKRESREEEGRGSKGMSPSYFATECVLPIHFLFIILRPSPLTCTRTHTYTPLHKHRRARDYNLDAHMHTPLLTPAHRLFPLLLNSLKQSQGEEWGLKVGHLLLHQRFSQANSWTRAPGEKQGACLSCVVFSATWEPEEDLHRAAGGDGMTGSGSTQQSQGWMRGE